MPESINTKNLKSEPKIPTAAKIPGALGSAFSREFGFHLPLSKTYSTSILIDKAFMTGDKEFRSSYLAKEHCVAKVVLCDGRVWEVLTEPIGLTDVGLIAYTASKKPIMTGTGHLLPNGDATFKLATLYPNITNMAKVTATAQGSVTRGSDGSITASASVSVSAEC